MNCLNIDYLERMKLSEGMNISAKWSVQHDFLGVPIDVDFGQPAVTAPDNARTSGSGLKSLRTLLFSKLKLGIESRKCDLRDMCTTEAVKLPKSIKRIMPESVQYNNRSAFG